VQICEKEFMERAEYLIKAWLPARALVLKFFENRFSDHASGQIMILKQMCPWKEHLYELEKSQSKQTTPVLFVLYEDDREKAWRIQAVSVKPGSFESRYPLPEPWRGLRDDELSQKTGISGCIFVHATGFIGGCRTFEGALQLTLKALAMRQ
jgi:uncharacterized UPF0160 family protein